MVSIPLDEGTITLNHEWPGEDHYDKYMEGEPVVSLEVDTDLGTAVVALRYGDLLKLFVDVDNFARYYEDIEDAL